MYGRETATKSIVAIAVEIKHSKGFGRIWLQSVADVSQESLIPFIEAVVEPGSTVHTDGWQAYLTVPQRAYTHERTVMRKRNDPAHVVMPGVHRVASLLLGAHQGGVGLSTSMRSSTSSRSVSTAGIHGAGECCSTACLNNRSRPSRSPTAAWSPTRERPADHTSLRHAPVASPPCLRSTVLGANPRKYGPT